MITIIDFIEEPGKYIWGDDCRLVTDSRFAEEFDGNLGLLEDCCSDNANPDGINYYKAIKDYNKSVKSA